jgi:Sec-independent protein secretion pathway component TatC
MAVPMCALWEIGLLFCKWFIEEEEEEDEEDEIQAAALAALPASESSAEKA